MSDSNTKKLHEQIKELETQNIKVGLILTEALSSLSKENSALKSRIEKLRKALEFYAYIHNWNSYLGIKNTIDDDDVEWIEYFVVGVDCSDDVGGKTARAALKADEG